MKFREMLETDLPAVRSLHEQSHGYPFPDFYNPLYITKNVITSGGDCIIAFGALRTTLEAVIAIDKQAPLIDRVDALKQLWELAKMRALCLGHDEIIAQVKDKKFEKLLINKFDFKNCSGAILTAEINHAKR